MARPDKVAAVADIAEKLRDSSAVVLTEYRGLSVEQLKELRRSLGTSASYSVVKNSLAQIAAKDAGFDSLVEQFEGPTAIAFVSGEPAEAAKALRTFSKENDQLVIKGGLMEGRPLSAEEVGTLADLESREVLLAKAAGAMKAAMFQAAYMFTAPATQAARTIEALREKQAAEA
ncbi:MAG TPA: 50S ribosomal protein L10 [Actinomycetaceae bacterium]|nr:50S ribosomal protein L10 [Actinomycetaceae bacterium]